MPDDKPLFLTQSETCRKFAVSLPVFKREFLDKHRLTPVYLTNAKEKPRPFFSNDEVQKLHDSELAAARIKAAIAKGKRRSRELFDEEA